MIPLIIALMRFLRYRQFGPSRLWGGVALAALAWLVLRLGAGVGRPAGATTDRVLPAGRRLAGGHDLVSPVGLAPGRNLTWSLRLRGSWGSSAGGAALLAFGGRMGTLGAGLAVVTLLPALAAVSRTGEVADRYLYLPLAGLGLALAGLLSARAGARTHGIVLVGILVLGGLSTSLSLPTWASDRSMWLAATQVHPSPYTWGGLAKTLEDLGELDDAPTPTAGHGGFKPFPEACYNVSNVHLSVGIQAAAAAVAGAATAARLPPSCSRPRPSASPSPGAGRRLRDGGGADRTPRHGHPGPAGGRRAPWGPRAPAGRPAERAGRPRAPPDPGRGLPDQAGEVEAQPRAARPRPTRPQREGGADPEAPPAEAAQGR